MIANLTVKNVALIEYAEILFEDGLNILSGETGSGKSMLIDAISFVLGEKADKDFIRIGAQTAEVEMLLNISSDEAVNALKQLNIEDCSQLLLSRTINESNRSVCKINGKTVTIGMLKEISTLLVDMHGQHEHQSLLNPNKHITLLDKFCEEEITPLKQKLKEHIEEYKEVVKKMKLYITDEKEREAKISMLTYQVEEIKAAALKPGEEDALLQKRKKLGSLEKLAQNTYDALENLSEHPLNPAYSLVTKAVHNIEEIASADDSKKYLAENIQAVLTEISEIIHDLKAYQSDLELDPDELAQIDARLTTIHSVKKKYGGTVEEVIKFYKEAQNQIEFIENGVDALNNLANNKKKKLMSIISVCENISKVRKTQAEQITVRIIGVLQELGMKEALFNIEIGRKKEFGLNGFDNVEFLISPNPGSPLKPLSKIASGGEMSRVMLALKSVLADVDNIETFIFDEIDTGVSGRTAQMVAEKLNILGKTHQILCITHLPQIAAMAKNHLLIEKRQNENSTTSHISTLDYNSTITELARLIGGAEITAATMKAADEMKQMAMGLNLSKN